MRVFYCMTPQREAFVNHYLVCWSAAEAARRAGYSAKSARQQASRLLDTPEIAAAIRERLAELHMSADEVLARLTRHARGSMKDFLRVKDDGQPVVDLRGAEKEQQLDLIKKIKIMRRSAGETTETSVEFELHDAQAALMALGKHHRLFSDRLEVDWRIELEALGLSGQDIDALTHQASDAFEQIVRAGAASRRASAADADGAAAARRAT